MLSNLLFKIISIFTQKSESGCKSYGLRPLKCTFSCSELSQSFHHTFSNVLSFFRKKKIKKKTFLSPTIMKKTHNDYDDLYRSTASVGIRFCFQSVFPYVFQSFFLSIFLSFFLSIFLLSLLWQSSVVGKKLVALIYLRDCVCVSTYTVYQFDELHL